MITIEEVDGKAGWREFESVSDLVYQGDPYRLPDESMDLGRILIAPPPSVAATRVTKAFLARENGIAVGRVVAIHDLSFTEYTGEPIGFFGFYEAVDDHDVAAASSSASAHWLSARGLATISGPFGPSMFYSAGIVVDEVRRCPWWGCRTIRSTTRPTSRSGV